MTPRVVYIASTGRSGSTLLELLLACRDATVSVGEVQILPHELRGSSHAMGCSCGEPVATCPFWTAVRTSFDPLVTGPGRLDLFREQHNAGRTVRPTLWRPLLARGPAAPPTAASIEAYADTNEALFDAVARVAGTDGPVVDEIVDSSKDPYRLLWLARSGRFDLRVIHLVRDASALVDSVLRRSHADARGLTRLAIAARKTASWDATNATVLAACRHLPATARRIVTYEELATDPDATLASLSTFLGRPHVAAATTEFLDLHLHAIAGNPMRADRAPIHADDSWKQRLSPLTRLTVRAGAAPVEVAVARARRGDA